MHITPVIITHIGRERRKDNKFEGVTVMGGGGRGRILSQNATIYIIIALRSDLLK